MGRFVEEENGDAGREAKVLHTSSCANQSDGPLRAKIVFSKGFHDLGLISTVQNMYRKYMCHKPCIQVY